MYVAPKVPWGIAALEGKVTAPAWKVRPSWYLVATDDRMIPPPAQRQMAERAGATTVEVPGSHAVYVSNPDAVRHHRASGRQGLKRCATIEDLGGHRLEAQAEGMQADRRSHDRNPSRRRGALPRGRVSANR